MMWKMLGKIIWLRLMLKILRKNGVEDDEKDNMVEVVVEDTEK